MIRGNPPTGRDPRREGRPVFGQTAQPMAEKCFFSAHYFRGFIVRTKSRWGVTGGLVRGQPNKQRYTLSDPDKLNDLFRECARSVP